MMLLKKTVYDKLTPKVNSIDTTRFVLKTMYDTNKSEIENKISGTSGLVKKTDYNAKITEIEFNTLAADVFNARPAQANLITKTDFDTKLSILNRKITSNKSKHLLVENELKKLKEFDSIYFRGKRHFEEDGTRNYLVFQPIKRYFKVIAGVGNGPYIYY